MLPVELKLYGGPFGGGGEAPKRGDKGEGGILIVLILVKCRPQHKNPKKGLPNSQTPRSGTLIRVLMLRPFSTSSGKDKKSKL